jgi:hypothetical protein
MPEDEKTEVYLEADKEIPGQHYVALSFISPNKILKNKDIFLFTEFLKDYEVQYKIKATEGFMMNEVKKIQEAASKIQDVLENLALKKNDEIKVEDISGALMVVKGARNGLTTDIADDLKEFVKVNVREFKEPEIQEAYDTFLFKNKKKLEDEFFAQNSFRTTVQGIKVRGVFDTYAEAEHRCKTLQKIDPSFNVYVGQVGFWLPWDPEPSDIANQEYADEQLNTLMKKYKENEQKRDELYNENKLKRMGEARASKAKVGVTTEVLKNDDVAGAEVDAPSNMPAGLFADDDLAIRRKKERAAEEEKKKANAEKNTLSM